ncbi:MAG: hypothetical protein FD143_3297, partial [Ignavibacteria bacterium]
HCLQPCDDAWEQARLSPRHLAALLRPAALLCRAALLHQAARLLARQSLRVGGLAG